MQDLTKTFFSGLLNQTFETTLEDGSVYRFTLARIQEYTAIPGMEQFSLIFEGTAAIVLPQQIYTLSGEGCEPFSIFLVPIGLNADRSSVTYEAVFNRLIKE